MRKLFYLVLFLLLLLFFVGSILKTEYFIFSGKKDITPVLQVKLKQLGEEALKSKDVPVSALLVYKNDVIGKGYNTVLRNFDAGGHAEINAISDAIKNLGFEKFKNLNRDSLVLISTLEPCTMCKGAIELYRIKYVKFLKPKTLLGSLGTTYGDFLYEYHKRQAGPASLQDTLFKKHPEFGNQTSY
jgi:tRNA(Arg) A34 adenosine deaminase TadA